MSKQYECAGPDCRNDYGASGYGPTQTNSGVTDQIFVADARRVALVVTFTVGTPNINEGAVIIAGSGSSAIRLGAVNTNSPTLTVRIQEVGEAIQRSINVQAVNANVTIAALQLLKLR